jgi:hypothetical protein
VALRGKTKFANRPPRADAKAWLVSAMGKHAMGARIEPGNTASIRLLHTLLPGYCFPASGAE